VGAPSSFGAQGGKAGVGGEVMLTLADDGKHVDAWKYGVHRFGPATYRSLSPGGGGFGDPRTRDPRRVLRDVRDGVVSAAAAEREYGVAITSDGRAIDEARTAALRGA